MNRLLKVDMIAMNLKRWIPNSGMSNGLNGKLQWLLLHVIGVQFLNEWLKIAPA